MARAFSRCARARSARFWIRYISPRSNSTRAAMAPSGPICGLRCARRSNFRALLSANGKFRARHSSNLCREARACARATATSPVRIAEHGEGDTLHLQSDHPIERQQSQAERLLTALHRGRIGFVDDLHPPQSPQPEPQSARVFPLPCIGDQLIEQSASRRGVAPVPLLPGKHPKHPEFDVAVGFDLALRDRTPPLGGRCFKRERRENSGDEDRAGARIGARTGSVEPPRDGYDAGTRCLRFAASPRGIRSLVSESTWPNTA
jgi:hypothetical protein